MKLQFIEAGEIVTTHGVRGEVKVLPWLDSPEDLCEFDRCRIGGEEYKIQQCRVQKTCNLVKLSGVDTMEQAQALRGKIIRVSREDAPKDLIFAAELEGVEVFCEDACIGVVQEVLDYPGNKVYVVKGTYEYMIPAVKEYVQSIDLDANRMQVRLIEGMRTDEN
jgi:16S rRNA processing protein RimM